ncbi:ABC transporter substrate-binding protein [Tamaricihabitans halophyticus]|uniref:ABC transporter substrate-binding protein n=1 Tax=Tamaricihabitans halophyticus TaxID=1262583 RepID=UPI001FB29E66|nr:ABC transporter substrate-binding protein [Tamaricihabitans halophyticus]
MSLVGGLVSVAAAPAALAQEQDEKVTLRVALTQEIDHLNPFMAILQSSTGIGRVAFDYLTRYSAKDQEPIEGLATDWKTSDDNLTWTFQIRDNAKWSDGEKLTAEDIAYTYNLIMEDETAATANGSFVSSFEEVTAPNDTTLVIKTRTPQATMLALDIPIVPEHVWSKLDKVDDPKMDQPPIVSSGPFTITEFRPKEFVRLEANKDYWDGAPEIDGLDFVFYDNADGAVSALQNGEVDLVNRLTPAQYETLEGEDNIAVNKAQGRRFNELLMNPGAATKDGEPIGDGHPALRDVRVRQAIAKAIDPQALAERVMSGYAEPGSSVIPPVFEDYYWEPTEDQRWKFDPAQANRELDAAGYERGPDGIRQMPNGTPLEFRLLGHKGRAFDEQSASFIVEWLKKIGIKVTQEIVQDDQVNEMSSAGEFDLMFSGWGVNPDPDYILGLHRCSARPNAAGHGGTTDSFFCDQEYDRLYARQLAEQDETKRQEIVKQMQERLYEQAPMVVLDYDNALEAYRSDKFADFNVQPQPTGVIMEQNGNWGYYQAKPGDGGAEGGMPTGAWIAIGAVAIVAVAGGGIALRKRGKSVDDRE